ncbi:MAG: hypothetical protein ABIP03_00385 [Aquihabitans sp.]
MEGQAGQFTEVPAWAVVSPVVVDSVRKELRRTTGPNTETAEITKLLQGTVTRADCP